MTGFVGDFTAALSEQCAYGAVQGVGSWGRDRECPQLLHLYAPKLRLYCIAYRIHVDEYGVAEYVLGVYPDDPETVSYAQSYMPLSTVLSRSSGLAVLWESVRCVRNADGKWRIRVYRHGASSAPQLPEDTFRDTAMRLARRDASHEELTAHPL